MNRRGTLLVALLMLPLVPIAHAQIPDGNADVAVLSLTVAPQPIVNLESVVSTVLSNPSSTDSYVTVSFTYGDGTVLNGSAVGSTNGRLVPAGGQVTVPLYWTPGADRAGNQSIRVSISATSDTNQSNNQMQTYVFVQAPKWALTLENATSNATTLPFGTAFVRWHAKNLGNANDTPLVTALSSSDQWEAHMLGSPSVVPPNGEAVGEVWLKADTDNSSINETINVTLASALNPAVNATINTTAIHVDQNATDLSRSFSFTGLPSQTQIFPGESLVLPTLLTNTGSADLLLDVNVSNITTPGWNVSVDAYNGSWVQPNQTIPLNLTLALRPGEQTAVRFVVNASNATGSAAALQLNVSMRDAPLLLALIPDAVRVQAKVDLLPSVDDVRLDKLTVNEPVYRGDDVTATLQVTNHGRAAANASNVTLVLADSLRTLGQTTLKVPALAAGASTNLAWTTHDAQYSGDVSVSAHLVGANSSKPDIATTFHVRDPILSLDAPEGIDVIPGGQLNLTGSRGGLVLHLSGDRAERVVATLEGGAEWAQATWTVDAPAGGDVVLPLSLSVPQYPHASQLQAKLAAYVQGRPAINATTALALVVDDQEGPDLQPAIPANGTGAGAPVTLAATADDATGVASVEVLVKTPSGEATLVVLPRNASQPGRYDAPFTPAEPGTYTLTFRAVDTTPEAHATSLPPVSWNVGGASYVGFTLSPAPDSVVSVRVVRALEVDPGSTASLEVDTGTGFRPVAFPYDISLEGWGDGRHAIRAHATSTKGDEWRATWNLTLDTTPPVITAHDVKTQADGRVNVSLSAADAVNASAKFHTGGGDVVVPLDSRGAGRFETVLAPPAGWTGVSLVAKDKAGNAASVEAAASVAKSPGLGALGALVALLGVALLARRR